MATPRNDPNIATNKPANDPVNNETAPGTQLPLLPPTHEPKLSPFHSHPHSLGPPPHRIFP